MEQARLLIAIVLSALIFLLWQLFFVDKDANRQSAKKTDQPLVKEEQVKESKPYPKEPEVAAVDKNHFIFFPERGKYLVLQDIVIITDEDQPGRPPFSFNDGVCGKGG